MKQYKTVHTEEHFVEGKPVREHVWTFTEEMNAMGFVESVYTGSDDVYTIVGYSARRQFEYDLLKSYLSILKNPGGFEDEPLHDCLYDIMRCSLKSAAPCRYTQLNLHGLKLPWRSIWQQVKKTEWYKTTLVFNERVEGRATVHRTLAEEFVALGCKQEWETPESMTLSSPGNEYTKEWLENQLAVSYQKAIHNPAGLEDCIEFGDSGMETAIKETVKLTVEWALWNIDVNKWDIDLLNINTPWKNIREDIMRIWR